IIRIAIAGSPQSGKTTLSKVLNLNTKHTDDLIHLGWSEASEKISHSWIDDNTIQIIEGVAVPRALRKWLKNNLTGKPVDKVIYLNNPYIKLTKGQQAMAKGCRTVWDEIKPELTKRGVIVEDNIIKTKRVEKIWTSTM
ncbi:MAG: hypothetical protein V3W20_08460, partial [Candidatus Neomarinimicrobiota bacterium]